MDIFPNAPALDPLRDQIQITHGDITLVDDVVEALALSKPDRVINLAYALGASERDPHPQVRLNILGMDNCFEAARILDIRRVVYASSLAVYGPQRLHGDRMVTEADLRLGTGIYAVSKTFNEHQADWYNRAYDMAITGIRPANITGPDKVRGSMNHVQCQVLPARNEPVSFPHRDTMTLPLHVEDIAEVFVRVTLAEATAYSIYNSGGHSTSMGDLADTVRQFLPDAEITFDQDEGGTRGLGALPDGQLAFGRGIRSPVRPIPATRDGDHQRGPPRGRAACGRLGRTIPSYPPLGEMPLSGRAGRRMWCRQRAEAPSVTS